MMDTLNKVVDFLNTLDDVPETPLQITLHPNGKKSIQVLSVIDFNKMFPQHDRRRFSTLVDELKVEVEGVEVVCLVGSVLA